MSRPSTKPAEVQRRISAPENAGSVTRGGKTPLSVETARECLNYGGTTAKQWADAMRVGERRVQKWRSGEDPIPEERRIEIVLRLPDLLTDQMIALQQMVKRALQEVFGGRDPDRF